MGDQKRRVGRNLLNLLSFCVFCLLIFFFLFLNQDAYADLVNAFNNFLTDKQLMMPSSFYNAVWFTLTGLGLWFIILTCTGIFLKDLRLILYEASLCVLSFSLGYIISFFGQDLIDVWVTSFLLLVAVAVQQALTGIGDGLLIGNMLVVLTGDWRRIIRSVRIALIGLSLMVPFIYESLYNLTVTLIGLTNLQGYLSDFPIEVLSFIELVVVVFLVTHIPVSLIFAKCSHCKSLILKRSISVSGWDSEHTLRHRHCPRCKAVIDL